MTIELVEFAELVFFINMHTGMTDASEQGDLVLVER